MIWVDLLTKQEFEAGFGSHTPVYSGQTQCVRYYMNFDRALRVFKGVLLSEGRAFDAHNVAGAAPWCPAVSRGPPDLTACAHSHIQIGSNRWLLFL